MKDLDEQKIKEKELEIKFRKLEEEVYRNQAQIPEVTKHEPTKKCSREIVKVSNFIAFVFVGVTLIQAGTFISLFIGIWLRNAFLAALIAFVGYKFFLEENSKN
ncbi:MAG: hypothetical protein ACRC2R_11090 [Xenococcaceae cyanobacterium]